MDERSRRRGLSGATLRHMRREAERDIDVVHDTPRREHWPRSGRPPRTSRHDVEWKDVEPALSRPLRPWDRPMPRPTRGETGRTHGRTMRRQMEERRGKRGGSRRRLRSTW